MTITGQSIVKCQQAIGYPIVAPLLQIDRWCGSFHVSDWERGYSRCFFLCGLHSAGQRKDTSLVLIFAETFRLLLEGNKEISGEDCFCGSWFSFGNCDEKVLRELANGSEQESGVNLSLNNYNFINIE